MKPFMLFNLMGVLSFSLLVTALSAQVKIGDNPGPPHSSAVLELEKSDMGLLIPRVNLADAQDNETIPDAANSLLVYNENWDGSGNDEVSPGFYYWDSDNGRWVRLLTGSGISGGDIFIDGNNNILSSNSSNQSIEGWDNVILGGNAFNDDNGASSYVIAIGQEAAQFDTTYDDAHLIAIGYQAAKNNGGYNVIAMGQRAASNNTGNDVNAKGLHAADENSGWAINAFGVVAAKQNSGYIVNALGPQTGERNEGNSVNAMGHLAAWENKGSEVNALGAMSAHSNTQSAVNALGRQAAMYNTGYGTNALGDQAAKFNSGGHAVAIGNQALMGDTLVQEGPGNIGIGYQAGINVGTGENNICIGFETDIHNPSENNQINIGNSIIRDKDGVIQLKDLIRLTPLSSAPSYTQEGTIYYDGTEHKLKVWTDAGWVDLH